MRKKIFTISCFRVSKPQPISDRAPLCKSPSTKQAKKHFKSNKMLDRERREKLKLNEIVVSQTNVGRGLHSGSLNRLNFFSIFLLYPSQKKILPTYLIIIIIIFYYEKTFELIIEVVLSINSNNKVIVHKFTSIMMDGLMNKLISHCNLYF